MSKHQPNPLRSLRENFCLSRADFCRRHRLGYQSIALAEVGLVENPANFLRVLAQLSEKPVEQLHFEYREWRRLGQQVAS